MDDDGDGLVDCEDGACAGDAACPEWTSLRLSGKATLYVQQSQTAGGRGACQVQVHLGWPVLAAVSGSSTCHLGSGAWLTWSRTSGTASSGCSRWFGFAQAPTWGTAPEPSSACALDPHWSDLAPGTLIPVDYSADVAAGQRVSWIFGGFAATTATVRASGRISSRYYRSSVGGTLVNASIYLGSLGWTVPARVEGSP